MTQTASHNSHTQDALAGLRRWQLERDDESDPGGRIYRDGTGTIYHSVTRILSATAPEQQQEALRKWLERPGSEGDRALAAERGTLTHAHAEYLLKATNKLVRNTANKRGLWKTGSDGLERAPKAITAWAMEKAIQGAPSPSWSASGYARGLRHWIAQNITAIHAVEFSVFAPLRLRTDGSGLEPYDVAQARERSDRVMGFAGSADGLLDIAGTLSVVDWKTTKKSAHACMETVLEGYKCQAAAYVLGLKERTGIEVDQAAIVLARRTGAPAVTIVKGQELKDAEQRFLERCARYFSDLSVAS